MSTQTETREHSLTEADKAAIADYCGLRPERIIALHEGVMVRPDPQTVLFRDMVTGGGQPFATVEVIYAKSTGSVAAVRHKFATAEEFLAVARREPAAA